MDGHEGYINVGFFEDGKIGEVFIKVSKQGSTLNGLLDSVAIMTSMSLQYGVPLEVLAGKFKHTKFEPAGMTDNPEIPIVSSILDYVFRWLEQVNGPTPKPINGKNGKHTDNKICYNCGGITVRSGSCYVCTSCGETTGCS